MTNFPQTMHKFGKLNATLQKDYIIKGMAPRRLQ